MQIRAKVRTRVGSPLHERLHLLDDLRERIWQHYLLALHEIIREHYGTPTDTNDYVMPIDDPPL